MGTVALPKMAFKKSVTFCECWPRDGLQSIRDVVPTHLKVEMIDRLVHAGCRKLEVTSFSHPKLLPQFADAVEILKQIERKNDVSYVVLMPNLVGFERFSVCHKEGYGANEIILMISSSEKHNLLNFRLNHMDAMKEHAKIVQFYLDEGTQTIMLEDTTGVANQPQRLSNTLWALLATLVQKRLSVTLYAPMSFTQDLSFT